MAKSAPAARERPGAGTEVEAFHAAQPIAAGDLPGRTVRGLGVCDVLQVDLRPVQIPWLVDQIEEMRRDLEGRLDLERSAVEAADATRSERVDAAEYELYLLPLMQSRLPTPPSQAVVPLIGPSGMVEKAVRGALHKVVVRAGGSWPRSVSSWRGAAQAAQRDCLRRGRLGADVR
jgi:hypothetical protein